jgi:hypothetical protein
MSDVLIVIHHVTDSPPARSTLAATARCLAAYTPLARRPPPARCFFFASPVAPTPRRRASPSASGYRGPARLQHHAGVAGRRAKSLPASGRCSGRDCLDLYDFFPWHFISGDVMLCWTHGLWIICVVINYYYAVELVCLSIVLPCLCCYVAACLLVRALNV